MQDGRRFPVLTFSQKLHVLHLKVGCHCEVLRRALHCHRDQLARFDIVLDAARNFGRRADGVLATLD